MTALANEVLTLSNSLRAQGVTCQGVAYPVAPALLEDKTLNAAAQHRADDLAQTEDFTHTPANGRTYQWWLDQVHFKLEFPLAQHDGENLGSTVTSTPKVIVASWLASIKGHCEVQFTNTYKDTKTAQWMPGFTRVGVGEAVSGGSGLHYWVVLFAN
ncbi:CAP domain-containing protein [Deinococcus sp. KNUC1210]|uniref:CAP domain-containing protein n=1 Tax=Deinococcus sp. KNUC1210 TaxID=2917691 RepID=UPI001EEFA811|nr:CAP domain-containing protein [Deinococcus sp. KNUC1210]ULH15132.1 CAP domain-containing protein [Deinococcus sp. KNUC1210]